VKVKRRERKEKREEEKEKRNREIVGKGIWRACAVRTRDVRTGPPKYCYCCGCWTGRTACVRLLNKVTRREFKDHLGLCVHLFALHLLCITSLCAGAISPQIPFAERSNHGLARHFPTCCWPSTSCCCQSYASEYSDTALLVSTESCTRNLLHVRTMLFGTNSTPFIRRYYLS
jgi:hypothetical protein